MPLPPDCSFTSEDYWNLPEGRKAELIDGQFYDMAPPNRSHQELVAQIVSPEDMCRESPSDGRPDGFSIRRAFHKFFYISRYHTI